MDASDLPRATAEAHQSKEKMPLPPDKKFHIFFCYRDIPRDKRWVRRLINKLETEYGYICCEHERDFLGGTNIMANIRYGVKNSEKVVVVFSKEAMVSPYVSLEAELAFKLSLETGKKILIPVLLDDCDVPEEYMLLTYIDAREGVEEATWLPKLLKSLESTGEASRSPFDVEGKNVAAGKEFAITQLCSIETKYNYRRRSIQPNSKYIPEKLRSEPFGVPADLSRALYKNLLRSPRVECRQKYYLLARPCVVIGYLIFAFSLFYFIVGIYYFTQLEMFDKIIASIFVLNMVTFCYFRYMLIYVKVPADLSRAIYEILLLSPRVECRQKYYLLTRLCVVIGYLIFAFEPINAIIGIYSATQSEISGPFIASIFLLSLLGNCYLPYRLIYVKNPRSVHYKIIDYNRILSKYGVQVTVVHGYMWKTASLIFYKCRFELCKEYVIRHLLKEGITHTTEHRDIPNSDPMMASTDGSWLLSGVGRPSCSREKKAMDLLMWYTPEYLDLAYANKLKNPKEDRHGIEFKCLCQYLEEADDDFRWEVKMTKSFRRRIDIEENYQDEANSNFENILLE